MELPELPLSVRKQRMPTGLHTMQTKLVELQWNACPRPPRIHQLQGTSITVFFFRFEEVLLEREHTCLFAKDKHEHNEQSII